MKLTNTKTKSGPKGFTLIELLVVLAILGMLAALVGPAIFSNLGKGQRATAASQRFQATLGHSKRLEWAQLSSGRFFAAIA